MTDHSPEFTKDDVIKFMMNELEKDDPMAQAIKHDMEKGEESIARQIMRTLKDTTDKVFYLSDKKTTYVSRQPQPPSQGWCKAYNDRLAEERKKGLHPSRN